MQEKAIAGDISHLPFHVTNPSSVDKAYPMFLPGVKSRVAIFSFQIQDLLKPLLHTRILLQLHLTVHRARSVPFGFFLSRP